MYQFKNWQIEKKNLKKMFGIIGVKKKRVKNLFLP